MIRILFKKQLNNINYFEIFNRWSNLFKASTQLRKYFKKINLQKNIKLNLQSLFPISVFQMFLSFSFIHLSVFAFSFFKCFLSFSSNWSFFQFYPSVYSICNFSFIFIHPCIFPFFLHMSIPFSSLHIFFLFFLFQLFLSVLSVRVFILSHLFAIFHLSVWSVFPFLHKSVSFSSIRVVFLSFLSFCKCFLRHQLVNVARLR